jgi:ferritin
MNEYKNETIEKKINDLIEISSNSKDELIVNMSTKFLKFIKEDHPEFFL